MALRQEVYAAGTAYTLTETPALCAFGTTSPRVTIGASTGSKRILRARAVLDLSACTLDAVRHVTLKLRKTSGTAADVAHSSTTVHIGIVGTSGQAVEDMVVELPEVEYTVSSQHPDTIQLWGSVDSLPGAGSIKVSEASIVVE